MAPTPEEILSDVVRNILRPQPPATLSLDRPAIRLPRPAVSHADWRGLSAFALRALFSHLPVPDLLRLGYLFTPRWREVWRMCPLYLHDKQFASLPIPRSEVADAITNVLEDFLHGFQGEGVEEGDIGGVHVYRSGVYSFRVESTEWRPEHAARWCAALQRGGPSEVVLFNRGQPPVLIGVPPLLLQCATVSELHLAFFTVEAGELDALTGTVDLGLYGCACRPGVVEGVVAACSHLHMLLWVQDCAVDSVVVVRSAPQLHRLSMLRTVSPSLTVDDAPNLRELLPGSTAALSISGAPQLTSILRLNLPATLEIDGTDIAVGRQEMEPQMRSVSRLWLALDYTALRGMEVHMAARVVKQMLRRFPCLNFLTIERKDAVPREEGMASRDDHHTHYPTLGLDGGLDQCLHHLTLFDFRGGKAELALLKAIMHSTHALWTVDLLYNARRQGPQLWHATQEALAGLELFVLMSDNHTLRLRNPLLGVRPMRTREFIGCGWCGSDLF